MTEPVIGLRPLRLCEESLGRRPRWAIMTHPRLQSNYLIGRSCGLSRSVLSIFGCRITGCFPRRNLSAFRCKPVVSDPDGALSAAGSVSVADSCAAIVLSGAFGLSVALRLLHFPKNSTSRIMKSSIVKAVSPCFSRCVMVYAIKVWGVCVSWDYHRSKRKPTEASNDRLLAIRECSLS